MSVIRLVENVPVPALFPVTQNFVDDAVPDMTAAVRQALDASGLAAALPPGGEIAVAVGSRGMAGLVPMVAATVAWFKEKGTRPFIVPCMGSHGGATDAGQVKVLADLGVTGETAGCPIRSSMETVTLGALDNGLPVFMDKIASMADGIFVINRVKPHTAFTGKHESGIVKMLSIGLGKQAGAEQCHSLGYGHFDTVMPAMARVILANAPVLGGLATVENAFDRPCLVEAVPRESFVERDAELLAYAKTRMPSLPVRQLDVLLVNKMGKEISGTGLDPNITGRATTPYKSADLAASRIGVLRLSEASKGNAMGVGCADCIPRSLFDGVDFDYTYANCITSTVLKAAFMPVIMPTDKAVLQCLIKTCNMTGGTPRLAYIRDTLTLDRFFVSAPVAEELKDHPACTVGAAVDFGFDAAGTLTGPVW